MVVSKPCLCAHKPQFVRTKTWLADATDADPDLADAAPNPVPKMEEPDVPDLAPEAEKNTIKDAHINVRISSADKKTILAKAKKAGLSTNDYVRRAALGKKIAEKVPTDLRRLLAGTATNLHQLTHLANAGKLNCVSSAQLTELVTRLLETLK